MYGYIPFNNAPSLAAPESYVVRVPLYVEGYTPDILDSNNLGIPNIIAMANEGDFTLEQQANINQLGGQCFADSDGFVAWKENQ